MILILMGLKYLTVACSKSLYFLVKRSIIAYREYLKRASAKLQKTSLVNMLLAELVLLVLHPIYLIQVIMDQNCHNSC